MESRSVYWHFRFLSGLLWKYGRRMGKLIVLLSKRVNETIWRNNTLVKFDNYLVMGINYSIPYHFVSILLSMLLIEISPGTCRRGISSIIICIKKEGYLCRKQLLPPPTKMTRIIQFSNHPHLVLCYVEWLVLVHRDLIAIRRYIYYGPDFCLPMSDNDRNKDETTNNHDASNKSVSLVVAD